MTPLIKKVDADSDGSNSKKEAAAIKGASMNSVIASYGLIQSITYMAVDSENGN